ncbi:MAG: hypothetical protein SPG28_00380 [Alloprevotella sp.]|nr:hypothetical protein [Alloprevotella sp.]
MTVKIISKLVKICSFIIFPKCFIVKISLIFAGIIKEQISVVLIIPKLLPKVVLTIANAPRTLCAGSAKALTSFTPPRLCSRAACAGNCAPGAAKFRLSAVF